MRKIIFAAMAAVIALAGSPAFAKGKKQVREDDGDSVQPIEFVKASIDVASNLKWKGASAAGYVGTAIDIFDNCGKAADAQARYDAAHPRRKSVVAVQLNEANNDCGRSVVSAIPVVGGVVDIAEGLEEGDPKKVICGAVSIGGTFATGGASNALQAAGLGCSILNMAELIEKSDRGNGGGRRRPPAMSNQQVACAAFGRNAVNGCE